MFGTLRYDRESHHAEFIDRTNSFLGDAATEHAACDKCRLTKLKCTGQRSGCDRCKVRGTPCVYSATGTRESRNGRKRTLSGSQESKEKKQQRPKGQASKTPSKPTRRKRVAPPSQESDSPIKQEDVGCEDMEEQTTQNSNHPLAVVVEHGVMDFLGSWNHSHMDTNFELPPSPNSLPVADICMRMETESHANAFMDACDITTSMPTDYGAYDHERDFELFTSSTADSPISSWESSESTSEATSPMFTHPPSTPVTTQADANTSYFDHNGTGSPCGCLGIIVTMLEELDELEHDPSTSMSIPAFTISYSTIDDILASLKTQITHAAKILRCTICYSRREHISLLTRACEMLVRLAGRIVLSYQTQQHQAHILALAAADSPPLTPAASPKSSTTQTNVNPANISLDGSGVDNSSSTPDSTNAMFLGRYKTDASEWECLLRVLIGFQLNALTGLLGSVRKSATGTISTSQMARLHSAEAMVCGLVRQLEAPIGTTVNMGDTRIC